MALDHFYTIRVRKRNFILDAIEKCMQTHNYDQLSINDIVVEADISRGSFYNYFTDKSDAVKTLVREKIKSIFEIFKVCIEECDGDFFEGVREGYNRIKDMLRNVIFRTIMKNLKYFIEIGTQTIYSKDYEKEMTEYLDWLIANTKEGKTILKTRKQMANVVDLLISLLSNVTLKLIINENDEGNNDDGDNDGLEFKFNIIKNGVLNSEK